MSRDKLTVSQWADSMGISKQAGYQAVRRCGIPIIEGKVDPDVATTLYRKYTRARTNERRRTTQDGATAAGQPLMPVGDGDYWANRARREKAEADTAELKLAELRGELVRVADVKAAQARRIAALREGLLQIPARLAAVLAAESDQARCHDVLQAELHAVLAQVTEAS